MLSRGVTDPTLVKPLQRQLAKLNWSGVVEDGNFGLITDAAVRQTQRIANISPDGIVGPVTQTAFGRLQPFASPRVPIQRNLAGIAYRSQRDNAHYPSSTCNVTSYAMVLAGYFGVSDPPGKQLEDALFEIITSPEGVAYAKVNFPWAIGSTALWTVHGMLVWAAAQLNPICKMKFSTTRTWTQIVGELSNGRPVVLSGKFTASGHIVCATGLVDPKTIIVHDPWGDWNRGYREVSGSYRCYTKESLDAITGADGARYAHFVGA